jgi:hypothetical protein
MKNEKATQKSRLIYEFGILIQPFEELSRGSAVPTLEDYRKAIAKAQAGEAAWRKHVKEFATFGDVIYTQECKVISGLPAKFWTLLRKTIDDPLLNAFLDDKSLENLKFSCKQHLEKIRGRLLSSLEIIPVEWESAVFEANTPFTAYLAVRDAIVPASTRLHYFDRYLKPDFFTLFLQPVGRNVSVRLVTTAGNSGYGVAAVLPYARLAGAEFKDLKLIEVQPKDLHDRNLRVDDRIFQLGPGVDRAGFALTNFGPADNSAAAHRAFDKIITKGREVALI